MTEENHFHAEGTPQVTSDGDDSEQEVFELLVQITGHEMAVKMRESVLPPTNIYEPTTGPPAESEQLVMFVREEDDHPTPVWSPRPSQDQTPTIHDLPGKVGQPHLTPPTAFPPQDPSN